ncbi:HET-domain-containing protein [Apiospora arundinis]
MRLLNTTTLRLETFTDERSAPPYAILSHTWEEDEVLFDDIKNWASSGWAHKQGAQKVRKSAEQALSDDLKYIWIDTLCIDKSSSAELSEAINSMFNWYQGSAVCYAYLFDIDSAEGGGIENCKWLSRGWTLQELIAPERVRFFDMHWHFMGTRNTLAGHLDYEDADPDDVDVDGGRPDWNSRPIAAVHDLLASVSVASRMFWASRRQTTRCEDAAYCLMGLFNVNMPLLYGEGKKAFVRLQEEIIKVSTDTSILAFANSMGDLSGVLAPEPASFRMRLPAVWEWDGERPRMLLEKDRISLEVIMCASSRGPTYAYALLDGSFDEDYLARPAILLHQVRDSVYERVTFWKLYCVHRGSGSRYNPQIAFGDDKPNWILDPPVMLKEAKRVRITLVTGVHPAEIIRQRRPALRIVDTPPPPAWDTMTYRIVHSLPPLRDNTVVHQPEMGPYDGADGIIVLCLQRFNPPMSPKEWILILWGTTARGQMKYDPWCKICTIDDTLALISNRSRRPDFARLVFGSDKGNGGDKDDPSGSGSDSDGDSRLSQVRAMMLRDPVLLAEADEKSWDTVLAYTDMDDSVQCYGRVTVSMESTTFLERTTLEMRISVDTSFLRRCGTVPRKAHHVEGEA